MVGHVVGDMVQRRQALVQNVKYCNVPVYDSHEQFEAHEEVYRR